MDIDSVKIIGSCIVVVSLIFFIFNNAVQTANLKRKAVYFLLLGIVLFGLLFSGILKDLSDQKIIKKIEYYAFPSVVVAYTIVFTTVYFIKARKYNHHFTSYKKQTPKQSDEHLYILFKNKDNYLLNVQEGKFTGYVVKFDRKVYFHDDMVIKTLERLNLTATTIQHIGNVKVKDKKDHIYYCYEINLEEISESLQHLSVVNKMQLQNISAIPFHKNIILRMLIREKFDINL